MITLTTLEGSCNKTRLMKCHLNKKKVKAKRTFKQDNLTSTHKMKTPNKKKIKTLWDRVIKVIKMKILTNLSQLKNN